MTLITGRKEIIPISVPLLELQASMEQTDELDS
jgi:hypothetical protein